MNTPRDWSLRAIHEFMKNAACTLAELDEKDPYALIKDGNTGRDMEIWQAYIHTVRRTTAILIPFFEMMNSQHADMRSNDIMEAVLEVAEELRHPHRVEHAMASLPSSSLSDSHTS